MRYKYGGEGGIRTLDTVLSVYPLSRRAPSAVSATPLRGNDVQCVVSWILLAILPVPVNRFSILSFPAINQKCRGALP